MKPIRITLLLASLGVWLLHAHATLILYEPFNYAEVGGQSSTNGGGKDDSYVAPGSLAVNGLAVPVGNSLTNGGSGMSLRRLLGSINSSGTLFFSVVLRMNQLGTNMVGTNLICNFLASDDS